MTKTKRRNAKSCPNSTEPERAICKRSERLEKATW